MDVFYRRSVGSVGAMADSNVANPTIPSALASCDIVGSVEVAHLGLECAYFSMHVRSLERSEVSANLYLLHPGKDRIQSADVVSQRQSECSLAPS